MLEINAGIESPRAGEATVARCVTRRLGPGSNGEAGRSQPASTDGSPTAAEGVA